MMLAQPDTLLGTKGRGLVSWAPKGLILKGKRGNELTSRGFFLGM